MNITFVFVLRIKLSCFPFHGFVQV